jgi:hypothetical protein
MRCGPLWTLVATLAALLTNSASAQASSYLKSDMFGRYVPSGGSENAVGDFNGEIDFPKSRLCFYLELTDLPDPDAVQIHKGGATDNGPTVLTLPLPKTDTEEVCVSADEAVLEEISQKPEEYYVVVRSPQHPNGAIRGQLEG